MSRSSRILLASASLGLLLVLLFPIWTIRLEAPQYPEGLGLHIRATTIDGVSPNDLQNINGLNHYIGMKRIEPDAIPELKIMPWILVALSAFGLAVAFTGRRWALFVWFGVLLIAATGGLVDFWMWEYDYGHNLDQENAIIKVPGMHYQPPLIGSRKLLNFVAHSWPGIGGWIAFVCTAIGAAVVIRERPRRARVTQAARVPRGAITLPSQARQ